MANSCDYMGAAKVSCGQQHALRTNRHLLSLSLSHMHTADKKAYSALNYAWAILGSMVASATYSK